jgi:hypothetical protein
MKLIIKEDSIILEDSQTANGYIELSFKSLANINGMIAKEMARRAAMTVEPDGDSVA